MSSTSVEQLHSWFKRAVKEKATHLVVVCDTFDYTDYPVFVDPAEDVKKIVAKYDGPNMQKVHEVYKISLGWAAQADGRVWNL